MFSRNDKDVSNLKVINNISILDGDVRSREGFLLWLKKRMRVESKYYHGWGNIIQKDCEGRNRGVMQISASFYISF